MQKTYFPFLNVLLQDPRSIFYESLTKLDKENERWQWILHLALFREPEEVHEWAKEARKNAWALAYLASQEAKTRSKDKIDESLKEGDAWLHKWVKDNPPPLFHY